MKILESRVPFKTLTVMVQKEVAERICAPLGTRNTGALSVIVNYFCKPEYLFTVDKGNFVPVPKVDSAVIKLSKLSAPPVKLLNESTFFKVIKMSFLQRRKMLSNSIAPFCNLSKEKVAFILKSLGVNSKRPENLNLEQFASVSNKISESMYGV